MCVLFLRPGCSARPVKTPTTSSRTHPTSRATRAASHTTRATARKGNLSSTQRPRTSADRAVLVCSATDWQPDCPTSAAQTPYWLSSSIKDLPSLKWHSSFYSWKITQKKKWEMLGLSSWKKCLFSSLTNPFYSGATHHIQYLQILPFTIAPSGVWGISVWKVMWILMSNTWNLAGEPTSARKVFKRIKYTNYKNVQNVILKKKKKMYTDWQTKPQNAICKWRW